MDKDKNNNTVEITEINRQKNNIRSLTGLMLSEKIKSGEISVKEAVDAYFEKIHETEADIHAFITLMDSSENRELLEKRIDEVQKGIDSGKYTGKLAGVPIAVKDNICTKGIRTTCASKILENFVPQYDAEVIRRIEDAGMIIIGKTNMDEFAMGSTTENSAFGVTRNPWNIEHVPGGSSGGSCAAVASGQVPLALGTDTGGSIRQPASHCGVTGFKPTYGRVSRNGLVAYASSLDQIGPIGRNVEDCIALYEIIAGNDKHDSTSVCREIQTIDTHKEECLKGKRIGIPLEYVEQGVDKNVRETIEKAAEVMTNAGATVEYISLKMTDYVIPAYYVIASAEASSNLERFDGVKYGYRCQGAADLHDMYKRSRTEGFGTEVKRRILLGSFVLSAGYYDAYYLKALKVKELIKKEFDKVFEKYDCIMAPAAPTAAPKLQTYYKEPMEMYLSDICTVAINLCGLPAISVPCSKGKNGLPIGIQLVGNLYEDSGILEMSAFFQKCNESGEV